MPVSPKHRLWRAYIDGLLKPTFFNYPFQIWRDTESLTLLGKIPHIFEVKI